MLSVVLLVTSGLGEQMGTPVLMWCRRYQWAGEAAGHRRAPYRCDRGRRGAAAGAVVGTQDLISAAARQGQTEGKGHCWAELLAACRLPPRGGQRRPCAAPGRSARRYLKQGSSAARHKEAAGAVRWPRPRAPCPGHPASPGLAARARRCPDASPPSPPPPRHHPQMLSFFWLR